MSLAHKGKPNKGHFVKGFKPWNYGKGKQCQCPECRKLYMKYYLKLYQIRNKNKIAKLKKIYKEKNRDKLNAWRRRNYIEKPTIKLSIKRRKLMKKGGGFLGRKTIQEVYEDNIKKYGTLTCYLCLKPIEFGKDNLEHKIPLIRGGTNARENLDVAHKSCNSKKGTLNYEEYVQKQEGNYEQGKSTRLGVESGLKVPLWRN